MIQIPSDEGAVTRVIEAARELTRLLAGTYGAGPVTPDAVDPQRGSVREALEPLRVRIGALLG
jgi:hypothetical protein